MDSFRVTQSISTTTNSPTAVKLLEYAGDNQAWIDDFGPVSEVFLRAITLFVLKYTVKVRNEVI